MVTLIVLLCCCDHTPLKPWFWGLTLNGTISVISFIWKACVSYVISNSIGQLKWPWFHKREQPADLGIFDEASRSAVGGFKLIVRVPWGITRIAGLIAILKVASDPFFQQLVTYPTITQHEASSNATITRGVTYTMEAPDQQSCTLQPPRKTQFHPPDSIKCKKIGAWDEKTRTWPTIY